jgi:membrane protease YdiL (CAAX protease family)
VGKNIAVPLSAVMWDLSHLLGLVGIAERFFYGLVYAVVFRLRQNSTPTMIVHPIGHYYSLPPSLQSSVQGWTQSPQSC